MIFIAKFKFFEQLRVLNIENDKNNTLNNNLHLKSCENFFVFYEFHHILRKTMIFDIKIGVFDKTKLRFSSFTWIGLSYNFDILLLIYGTKNKTKIYGLQSYAKFVIHPQT